MKPVEIVVKIYEFTALDVMWYALKAVEPVRPRSEVAGR